MEEREGSNTTAGFGTDGFLREQPPRTENPKPFPAPTSTVTVSTAENAAPPFSLTMQPEKSSSDSKKKRGRPRKYNPDGSLAITLSPMPISSSLPLPAEVSHRKRGRGRGTSFKWLNKSQMLDFDSPASTNYSPEQMPRREKLLYSSNGKSGSIGTTDLVGANLTPHVLTVNAGEDVTVKVMTFSQQGSHAICILSATGPISNVTLHQPMASGGTLTYEGRFEILSLMGSFTPNESGGTRSRAGGMSVSLSGPDGRVFGGGLAGLFIAAGPVQVVVGSFIAGEETQPNNGKKQRKERTMMMGEVFPPHHISFGSEETSRIGYGSLKPAAAINPNLTNPHSYYTNSANLTRDLLLSSLQGEEDEDDDDYGGDGQSDDDNTQVPSG